VKIPTFILVLLLLILCSTSTLFASTLWGVGVGGVLRGELRVRRIDVVTGETSPSILVAGNGSRSGVLDLASDPIREPEVVWSLNFTRDFGSELISFNPHLEQTLFSVALDDNLGLQGLAIDPTNGQFYAASPTTLYKINPVTGEATQVGLTAFDVGKALGFDLLGNLYGSGTVDLQRVLVSINKASAVVDVVGPISAGIEDIAARPEDGVMYGLGFGGEPAAYTLYQIDLMTGSLKDIGPSLGRPGGLAFTGIPEPSTLVLLMIAIVGLAFYRCFRQTIPSSRLKHVA